jgi:hypothetical protein
VELVSDSRGIIYWESKNLLCHPAIEEDRKRLERTGWNITKSGTTKKGGKPPNCDKSQNAYTIRSLSRLRYWYGPTDVEDILGILQING